MSTERKTVKRAHLSPLHMAAGAERKHPRVIDGGHVKEWVGIGWIEVREATKADLAAYPHVID